MTRTGQRPTPALPMEPEPASSNVVELRPGFTLSPSEVAPKVSPRTRRRVTRGPNLIGKVTRKTGKNDITNKGLIDGTGLTQLNSTQSVSPSLAVPSPNDPTFQRLVANLPAMKLREAFPLEAVSHQNMMGRARQGGYTVDPAFHDFRSFLAHVGPRASEDWTLDRLEPRNPVYGPGLVRWADKRQQANNRADTVFLTMDGVTRPLAEWARLTGQERRTLAKRIDRGWSHIEAIRGHRSENEPTPDDAPLPVVEVPAQAISEGPESWPAGVSAGMWEEAWREFCSRLAGYRVPGLTRSVFFAWVGTNALRHANETLAAAFPNYFEGIDPEPVGYADHQSNRIIEAYDRRVSHAWRLIAVDDKKVDALEGLIRNYPHARHPKQAAKVIEKDEEF